VVLEAVLVAYHPELLAELEILLAHLQVKATTVALLLDMLLLTAEAVVVVLVLLVVLAEEQAVTVVMDYPHLSLVH
jgi:hypothetical protein